MEIEIQGAVTFDSTAYSTAFNGVIPETIRLGASVPFCSALYQLKPSVRYVLNPDNEVLGTNGTLLFYHNDKGGTTLLGVATKATEIVVPEGITSFHYNSFARSECKSLTLPSTVLSLADRMFKSSALTRVDMGATGITKIPVGAFSGCPLTEIVFPARLDTIEDSAISSCSELKSENIHLPESVVYLGEGCFGGCLSFQTIELGDNIRYVGPRAFSNCTRLKSFKTSSSLRTIEEETFTNCPLLTSVEFKEGLDSIGARAFLGCPLENLNLPQSLRAIGDNAFVNTAISHVNIPPNVTYIAPAAFACCENLKEIAIAEGGGTLTMGMIQPDYQDFFVGTGN